MGEHPILFSGPMVRAILEGRKTQTRRVMNPQPYKHEGSDQWFFGKRGAIYSLPGQGEFSTPLLGIWSVCPFGHPGDLLWVRETWLHYKSAELEMAGFSHGTMTNLGNGRNHWTDNPDFDTTPNGIWKQRPSIHMPRWASRLTLRITDVRVQRLQEITDGDVAAEGVDWSSTRIGNDHGSPARDAFVPLWDSINAKRGYSWDSNSWVWAITFKLEDA